METAIRVRNLVKRYDKTVAVDHVDLVIAAGERFGLLGPNGAGKTTIINILAALLRPTSGQAEVAGMPVEGDRDALRRRIGIVFQETALDVKLTGRENLQFHAMLYGVSRPERRRRIARVLELVDLQDRADLLVETYSGGMKRRLEIARGFIHHPQVLFLDEPTLGLDAQTRRRIWEYVLELNRQSRVTVILTTHYMDEADFLCERVAIIDRGKIIAMDTPARLKETLGGDMVHMEIAGDGEAMVRALQGLKWVRGTSLRDGRLRVTMERGDRRIPELMRVAQRSGAEVLSVNLSKPSLEDVFLHFTGRTIREDEAPGDPQFRYVRTPRRG
jgi:ABC-2 type transport system ATP-binding protein